MKIRHILTLFGALSLWVLPLTAEIESVLLRYSSAYCGLDCAQKIVANFQRLPGVAQISVNPLYGSINLLWRPGVYLDVNSIYNTMNLSSTAVTELRVKVRGTIRVMGYWIFLFSLGDNTSFVLLGPPITVPGLFLDPTNLQNLQLSPYLRQQLIQGASENRIAIIEGPLFPSTPPPNYLIIHSLSFEVAPTAAPQ